MNTHDSYELNLGPCCICDQEGPEVRNILMLPFRGPIPGRGWGCLQCGLPPDGASAVLCDDCLEAYNKGDLKLNFICSGYPEEDGRIPLEGYEKIAFGHDENLHEDDKYAV